MRFLSILTVFVLCLALPCTVFAASDTTDPVEISVVEVSDRRLGDLASWQLDTNLGSITLYCPVGVDSSGIVIIENSLVNLTNTTVYFYSPQYPDYTFSAARFSPVFYRSDNYNQQLLVINSVQRSSVNVSDYFDYITPFALLAIFLVGVWGCVKP